MEGNRKKYLLVMGVGTLINFLFYGIARVADLPILMNSVGTGYAAMLLEPAAGLLVGYVYNFFEAFLIYGPVSMIYYLTTAVTAVVIGVRLRRKGRIDIRRLPSSVMLVTVLNTVISGFLTIWRTRGDVSGGWEQGLMRLMEGRVPVYSAYFLSSFLLRLIDGAILLVCLFALYRITPRGWYVEEQKEL